MRNLTEFTDIYLYRDAVDMRKSINGLSLLVVNEMKQDVYNKALYVFVSRDRKKLKVLYWDESGFVLYYKRLCCERFKWVYADDNLSVMISKCDLQKLLQGYDVFQKPHKKLCYSAFI